MRRQRYSSQQPTTKSVIRFVTFTWIYLHNDGIMYFEETEKKEFKSLLPLFIDLEFHSCCYNTSVPCRQFSYCVILGSHVHFFTSGCISHRTLPHLLAHYWHLHVSMVTDQLPDRIHPTGSETKYHVFNNKITDNVDIYHSEATTLKPKACTMKYTKKNNNIRAHTVTTHIQPQNPEIIYEHLPYCSYQPYSFKCAKYISMVT